MIKYKIIGARMSKKSFFDEEDENPKRLTIKEYLKKKKVLKEKILKATLRLRKLEEQLNNLELQCDIDIREKV